MGLLKRQLMIRRLFSGILEVLGGFSVVHRTSCSGRRTTVLEFCRSYLLSPIPLIVVQLLLSLLSPDRLVKVELIKYVYAPLHKQIYNQRLSNHYYLDLFHNSRCSINWLIDIADTNKEVIYLYINKRENKELIYKAGL